MLNSQIDENDFINIVNEILYTPDNIKIKLTKKEQEILYLILQGYSNIDIEYVLSISSHTVKKHINNIYSKFCLEHYPKSEKRFKLLNTFILLLLVKFLKLKNEY